MYLDDNDLPLQQSRSYQLSLDVHHWLGRGLRVGFHYEQARWSMAVKFAYLQTEELLDGAVNGELTAEDNGFSGQVTIDYSYYEDKLLDRPIADILEGRGYTIDLELRGQPSPELSWAVIVSDAYSEIQWQDAPYTQARVNSDTVSVDDNGLLDVSPILQGFEGNRLYKQRIPVSYHVSGQYQLNRQHQFSVAWFRLSHTHFYEAEWSYSLTNTMRTHVSYEATSAAWGVGLTTAWSRLVLKADDLSFSDAHTVGVVLEAFVAF